ncbi:MAG: MarR family transcriptional regulator [Microbacteriaceae bacterium]|nr:MarR family transcriptional regulator [Microbacteriaceae bacterium]
MPVVGETTVRAESLARVIERMAIVTREVNARGAYPFKTLGLRRAAMNLLFALARSDGARVAELAERLGITSGAITQTVETLRQAGLVTSEVSADDRRGRVISLTTEARREIEGFERQYIEAVAPAFDALSTADVLELDRILSTLSTP